MTNYEAYNLINQSKRSVRNYKLLVAIDMALKALAWESVSEKEEQNENKHI